MLTARLLPEERRQPGVIFVPYGPWASQLVSPETHSTGMPSLKAIRAVIEPAPGEKPLGLRELLEQFYGRSKPGGALLAR